MKSGDAFALLYDKRRTIGRPDSHKEMDMIGLDSQFEDMPAFLLAFLLEQNFAPLCDLPGEH